MKKIKYMLGIALMVLTSCTSSKQVLPVPPEPANKSYKLPACHKAMHEQLLKNQHKLIITSASLNVDEYGKEKIK